MHIQRQATHPDALAGRPKDVPRKILILLDSPRVRSEVTTYSVELARRMAAALHLLMLIRWEASPPNGATSPEMGSEGGGGPQRGRDRGEQLHR